MAVNKADRELETSHVLTSPMSASAGPPIHKIFGDEIPIGFDARHDAQPTWKIWTSVNAEYFQKHEVGIIFTKAADIDRFPVIRLYRVFNVKDGSRVCLKAAETTVSELLMKIMRETRADRLMINIPFEPVRTDLLGRYIGSHEGFSWSLVCYLATNEKFPWVKDGHKELLVHLDLGLVEQGSHTISWNKNVTLTMGLERKEPRKLHLKHSPIGYFGSMDDDQNICIRWNGYDLLNGDKCRWSKLQYFSSSERQEIWGGIIDRMTFGRFIERSTNDRIKAIVPCLYELPLRLQDVRCYEDEWQRLRDALLFIMTRCNRAANCIQECWRRAWYDPRYEICRSRLRREFDILGVQPASQNS